MIDVEEMERIIDRRATQASAELHRTVATRQLIDVHHGYGHRTRAMLAAACALLVVVAGLWVIADRPTDQPVTAPNGAVVWTVGDLPSGWHVRSAQASEPVDIGSSATSWAVYATAEAPEGPIVVIDTSIELSRLPADTAGGNISESTVTGRRFVLSDDAGDRRQAWVEVGDTWIAFTGTNTSDELMRQIGVAMSLAPDGSVVVANTLPGELVLSGQGSPLEIGAAYWVGLYGQNSAIPTVSVDYLGPQDGMSARLTVVPSSESELPMLGFAGGNLDAVALQGGAAWFVEYQLSGGKALVWQRDRQTFVLTGAGLSNGEMVDLANSVRPSRSGELPQLSGGSQIATGPGETVPADAVPDGTSNPDDAPAETIPAPTVPDDFQPVDIQFDVQLDIASTNEATLSGAVGGGFSFEINVVVVADTVRIQPSANGESMGSLVGSVNEDPDQQIFFFGGGEEAVAVVATDLADATTLAVLRSNGDRYLLALNATPAHPEVRFAGIGIPSRELLSAQLLDADGKVLGEAMRTSD